MSHNNTKLTRQDNSYITYTEDLVQTHADPVYCFSLCEPIWSQLSCFDGPCSLGLLHYLWLLQSFLPLFSTRFPDFQREGLNGDLQFRLSLQITSCCGSLYLLPSANGGSFFDADWTRHRSIGIKYHNTEFFFASHVCFDLMSLGYPVSGFWTSR